MAEVWRRLAERPDSEHEQVVIRCAIALLAFTYLAAVAAFGTGERSLAIHCLPLAVAYVLGSTLLLAHLLWQPGSRPARRYAGMTLDMLTLTVALTLGEGTSAIFYPFYLWVTLGMGFRYGRRYLYVSALMSLVSFATVILITDFWHRQPALAAGLWAALLMLPAYSASLLAKLTDAVERAEAASRAKSRFLATMSHELRTPLNAIIGITDLLRAGRLDGEQSELVRTARLAGQNLLDMINDVLDVAKIESGKATIELVEFDLHILLCRVRSLLLPRAQSQGLYLNLTIDPAAPYRLRGGERALQQVLTNLVANGIKFTEQGGVAIRLIGLASEATAARFRIEVEDTGIGIAPEARERIFEQFAQADESTTRRYGGTGLGLTIARQLVGLLGGDLQVQSRAGAGSCFACEVAVARAPASARGLEGEVVVLGEPEAARGWAARIEAFGVGVAAARDLAQARHLLAGSGRATVIVLDIGSGSGSSEAAPAALRAALPAAPDLILVTPRGGLRRDGYLAVLDPDATDDQIFTALHAALVDDRSAEAVPLGLPGAARAPRRILLAEDNHINQMVIARILERGGHEVATVANGEQALDAIERQPFDLVLMDLNMPEMGGLEAMKLYRFMEPRGPAPEIVALTADITEETRAECFAAGIREIITKPVSAATLLAAVDRITATDGTPAAPAADPALARASNVLLHPRLASDVPALDRSHFQHLRQLDQGDGFFVTVADEFLADAGQLVVELQAAAAAGDVVTFRDRAHALRSSAAHMGARAIFELCLAWRGISAPELRAGSKTFAARLTTEFERMRNELLAEIEPARGQGTRRADAAKQVRRPQR